ncbi:MAG: UDP-N-acetylglucosamine 1-carboxyvinyltransferase [bacterium]
MSDKIIIRGGRELSGEVCIGGAKNAVLKLMAAAILLDDECILHNVPELTDVRTMIEVMNSLGVKTDYKPETKYLKIDASHITNYEANYEFVSKMRASFNVLGALLGRCKEAKVALPGGCAIGERRIDFHIKGLEALGAQIKIEGGYVIAKAKKLVGAEIYLDRPSVGATENLMIAAVLAEGSTLLKNAAQEPEIVDLANFLNALGADISGAGTSEIIINGVKQENLKSITYTTIPDRIEAGTYMAAVAATRGKVIIKNIFPNQVSAMANKLSAMGVNIHLLDPFSIEVSCQSRTKAVDVVTQPHPGFPTDLQSPIMAALTVSKGISVITESIYENRFRQIGELRRMGADVQQEGSHAIIKGVKSLTGTQVRASDLRAGAALIVASLCANGTSEILDLHHIDRGYENLIEKLTSLGADVQRVPLDVNDTLTPILQ